MVYAVPMVVPHGMLIPPAPLPQSMQVPRHCMCMHCGCAGQNAMPFYQGVCDGGLAPNPSPPASDDGLQEVLNFFSGTQSKAPCRRGTPGPTQPAHRPHSQFPAPPSNFSMPGNLRTPLGEALGGQVPEWSAPTSHVEEELVDDRRQPNGSAPPPRPRNRNRSASQPTVSPRHGVEGSQVTAPDRRSNNKNGQERKESPPARKFHHEGRDTLPRTELLSSLSHSSGVNGLPPCQQAAFDEEMLHNRAHKAAKGSRTLKICGSTVYRHSPYESFRDTFFPSSSSDIKFDRIALNFDAMPTWGPIFDHGAETEFCCKLGGINPDVPISSLLLLIKELTGVKCTAILQLGRTGLAVIWATTQSEIASVREHFDAKVWVTPFGREFVVVAKDQASATFLLEQVHKLATRKGPHHYPRHLVSVADWSASTNTRVPPPRSQLFPSRIHFPVFLGP